MAKTFDRASVIKMRGLAGFAAVIEALTSMPEADATGKGSPMNLTLQTSPTKHRAGLCYTISVGNKPQLPSNAKLIFQTLASNLDITVGGNTDWKPKPASGHTKNQWITVYQTPCP